MTNERLTKALNLRRLGALCSPAPWAALAVALTICGPASALTINATFSAAFTADFGANAAAAMASEAAAASIFTSAFSDPISINITFTAVTGTGTLGESSTPISSLSWSALHTAAVNDAKSADDMTATGAGGSITAADPTGGSGTFWATRAQEKALGIIPTDGSNDGTITVGTGFSYTFSGPIGAGTFDLTDVFAHEISEVMGRIGISGGSVGGLTSYTLLDALSYSAANTRGLGNGAGNFLSFDKGTTLLKAFNNQAGLGGDSRDWASGTDDAFNAFGSTGIANPVSAVDLREMDVLGYDPAAPTTGVPEPSTGMLLVSVIFAGGLLRRRLSASR
jgi:hypothetical protein